ncbi:hypothetical protein [Arsenophonus nasoniae]|uniref:hypothetical protein n=2 Tax=Arsenophonus nasoniae TaxID=638 RepID=UPI00246937CC|nr:hypothetical protein [Arsenophonus nasoniae]
MSGNMLLAVLEIRQRMTTRRRQVKQRNLPDIGAVTGQILRKRKGDFKRRDNLYCFFAFSNQ